MQALTQQELEKYLLRHPEERERLRSLGTQVADDPDIFDRSNMVGHITSSVLVLDASCSHVLLIHHKVYKTWMQPGGHVEPDSVSLLASGLREVQEETGLPAALVRPLWQGRVLDIDTHAIAARPDKGEGSHQHHDFLFAVLTTHQFEPTPQLEEVNGVVWLSVEDFLDMPGQRMSYLVPKLRSLLAAQSRWQDGK